MPVGVILAEGTGLSVANVLTDVPTALSAAVNLVTGQPVAAAFIGIAVAIGGLRIFKSIIHIR